MNRFHKKGKSIIFPLFVWISFILTIFAGVSGTILPSFDFFPAVGKTGFSISPWLTFFSAPGIGLSILKTLFSGMLATTGTVCLTVCFVSLGYKTPIWNLFEKILAPVLSIPHAAFAIGFGFLISPSGWFMRIVSPEITGYLLPPDWTLLNDPGGYCLTVALIMKEFPFLIMITIGALGRMNVPAILHVGQSMGYQKDQIWFKIIIPMLYPQLRLSIFAIIAYSLSVVDMALIVGPTSPPTLSVAILNWFNDPDITYKLVAAAGSVFLFFLVLLCISGTALVEKAAGYIAKDWIVNGSRSSVYKNGKTAVFSVVIFVMIIMAASSLVLVIWSVAWQWRFPSAFPSALTIKFWHQGLISSAHPILTTLVTGAAATFFSLLLAIGCLEHVAISKKTGILSRSMHWFLYIPLLLPQISFMAGVQLLLVLCKLDGFWIGLVWSHVLFVLPYIFITLGAIYENFDPRITQQAVLLGRSYAKAFFTVKLPMLLRPILFSLAIGFSVSVAQYIPTLLVGAGRFTTITTEVVTLASGSDRRAVAVYALIQQLLPLFIYTLALMIPKGIYYNKKGMH